MLHHSSIYELTAAAHTLLLLLMLMPQLLLLFLVPSFFFTFTWKSVSQPKIFFAKTKFYLLNVSDWCNFFRKHVENICNQVFCMYNYRLNVEYCGRQMNKTVRASAMLTFLQLSLSLSHSLIFLVCVMCITMRKLWCVSMTKAATTITTNDFLVTFSTYFPFFHTRINRNCTQHTICIQYT